MAQWIDGGGGPLAQLGRLTWFTFIIPFSRNPLFKGGGVDKCSSLSQVDQSKEVH